MRRADRLFRIVQTLRGRRLTTAAQLAETLGISVRTVYRDVRDLSLSGVPIEGEAGVGYRLRAGFDVPPLMFDAAELEALALGARMVGAWAGHGIADAARRALEKIAAAVPAERRPVLELRTLGAPDYFIDRAWRERFDLCKQAVDGRRVLVFGYRDRQGAPSRREVWPLGLHFWGSEEATPRWTLAAWCELRGGFRTFRIDALDEPQLTERRFPDADGRRLRDYLRAVSARD
ncbi:helix-turn-helix transcriptional regulator [Derxia gummosa]|uniref:Helix-turn-helix transcriptional regulator n=1 Tax=Derxia gummosa DSM 723 TaxID=1121388 RepID=A0A8B6X6P5_9BURK|nr:YafY family protein [Derxia gummosa]